jgi:hypothetical protein
MAKCPQCDAVIGEFERVCPACGNDVSLEAAASRPSARERRSRVAYSALAEIALGLGLAFAVYFCLASVVRAGYELVHGEWRLGAEQLFAAFAAFVAFVVIRRVQGLSG